MKFITSLLILLGFFSSFKVDEYDLYAMEGFIAYSFNANYSAPEIKKDEQVADCKCGGTGKVTMVDGNVAQCPCGPSCKCGKSDNKNVKPLSKRVIMFTDSKHCTPCKKFKNQTVPALIKAKWTFGDDASNLIQVFDASNNKDPKAFEDNFHKYEMENVPSFVLIENDKVIKKVEGFMTPKEFTDFFYGK